jgi:hypothetical protein
VKPNLALLSAAALAAALAGQQALAATAPQPPAPVGAFDNSRARLDAFAKLPDWSGVWSLNGPLMYDPSTTYSPPDPAGDTGGFAYGPLPGSYEKLPYKPEYQKKYEEIVHRQATEFIIHDPIADCVQPHGMPRALGGAPGPTEFTVTPEVVWITWNRMNQTRRIYTDGRGHPTGDDSWPMVMGHSIGHWEGDTLVVETDHMKEGILDRSEAFHSDQVVLRERIRRINENTIEDQITMIDPVMFTEPWHVTRTYRKLPKGQEVEGVYCENNRNPTIDGTHSAVLPGDKPVAAAAEDGPVKPAGSGGSAADHNF